MIRINKPEQVPENLIIDGKKKCLSHCLAYSDNLKNPKMPNVATVNVKFMKMEI